MFSNTLRERTRGHRVALEGLVELRFVTKTHYFHNGSGQLKSRALDGSIEDVVWTGLDGMGRVSGLGASRIGDNRSVTIGMDCEDPEIKLLFMEQKADVYDRDVVFWGQFYDEDLNPIDPKFHIYSGIADRLRMSKRGPRTRSIELVIEDFFARRRRSSHRVVSHADQQARDPGNTGFVYQQAMIDKILTLYDSDDA